MADTKLTALTELSVVDLSDDLYVVDDTGPTSYKLGLDRFLGLVRRGACQGRLTLTTGVPITTSDVTAASTLYWTPIDGGLITLYDGTRWLAYLQAELSLALSGLTADKPYDVFLDYNAGTPALALGTAWTNATTRAVGLTTQNGISVLTGSTTKRYVGTIYTTATTTTEDSALKRYVWNKYNPADRALVSGEVTDSHSYTTGTWREWNNGSNSTRLQFVCGEFLTDGLMWNTGDLTGTAFRGQGLDSLTGTYTGTGCGSPTATVVARTQQSHDFQVAAGFHFIAPIEFGGASGVFTNYNHGAKIKG